MGKMIAFTIFSFAIISFATADPIPQGGIAFAIAPNPDDLDWIPGVTCYQGRRKREAQNIALAIAPDPQDLLPPCPKSSSCYTEKGYLCKFPFTYKGTTYNKCTTDGSNNGKAWCAYAYKNRYPGDIEVNTVKVDDCQRSCDSGGDYSRGCQCTQKTNSHGGGRCQKKNIKVVITVTLTVLNVERL